MKPFAVLLCAALAVTAQGQSTKSLVGTVVVVRPETAEVEIRADTGDLLITKLTADTMAQRIAPGARDLKNAESIQVAEVVAGDRVLVTLDAGSLNARRIVIMPAGDIAKRDEADRLDWQKRGVGGIVSAKSGSSIKVWAKSMTADVEAVITVDEQTRFKRYAPDSVRFTEAKPSKLSEINIGDQLRARGEKSGDGHSFQAEEVVFGTFLVKAGTITAVNLESKEITVKELGSEKALRVALTVDSQIKQMPTFSAMTGGSGRGGMPGGSPGLAGRAGNMPGTLGTMGGPSAGFDINQMLERIPLLKLEDLRPGSTVVISSTKPAKNDQLTAIVVLANADMLIQMASRMSGGNRGGSGGPSGPGQGMGGNMTGGELGGLAGLGLSGILQ